MTKNVFVIPIRMLLKQKINSLIKIGGLAVGFTCSLLIVLYLHFELTYDRFHDKSHRIYRIVEDNIRPAGTTMLASAPGPVGPLAAQEFPEALRAVRFIPASMLMKSGEKAFQEDKVFFTDSTVFDIFTFPVLQGNSRFALSKPFSVVLTQGTAQKYFGDSNPIEQTLLLDNEFLFTVTAVIQDIPFNSHLRFDILLSMSTREAVSPGWLDNWDWSAYTYVEVDPASDPQIFAQKLGKVVERRVTKASQSEEFQRTFSLQPLTEIHLHSNRKGESSAPGSLSNLSIFSIVAVFILLIACVNFINLTTAQAGKRAREVGVRKAIGGTRSQLVLQFLGEAVIITFSAAFTALGLCSLLLPVFGDIVGLPLTTDLLIQPLSLTIYLGFSFGIGILAGCYPAFVLSRFRPAQVFKGSFKFSPQKGFLREGLIVVQFSIAIALVVATITVFTQLRYMQTKDLGYDKEGVVALYIGDDEDIQGRTETIKQELLTALNLFGATASSHIPGREPGKVRAEIDEVGSADVSLLSVDHDFFPFYDIPLVAGRNLTRESTGDVTGSLLVNEAAVRLFGFEKPEDILGKRISQSGPSGTIIGVVKDFHYTSLHKEIEPMVIRMRAKSFSYISLKINTREVHGLMATLEKRWRVIAPNRPFDYVFLDQQFEQLYHSDRQFGKIFFVSATISIILACLGLFGLVTFVVEQRMKEIGIRKIFGASVTSVHVLLSRNFLKPILIAIVIATLISSYGMNRWLEAFPYRTKLEIWTFIFAGGLAVVVTQVTLSFKSIKAALANPVDTLRND